MKPAMVRPVRSKQLNTVTSTIGHHEPCARGAGGQGHAIGRRGGVARLPSARAYRQEVQARVGALVLDGGDLSGEDREGDDEDKQHTHGVAPHLGGQVAEVGHGARCWVCGRAWQRQQHRRRVRYATTGTGSHTHTRRAYARNDAHLRTRRPSLRPAGQPWTGPCRGGAGPGAR